MLVGRIEGRTEPSAVHIEPTRLIVRQSCGCRPERSEPESEVGGIVDPFDSWSRGWPWRRSARRATAPRKSSSLSAGGSSTRSWLLSPPGTRRRSWRKKQGSWRGRTRVMRMRTRGRPRISTLYRSTTTLGRLAPGASRPRVVELLDRARLQLTEQAQRQTYRACVGRIGHDEQAGTADLRAPRHRRASDDGGGPLEHLPGLGIDQLVACLYVDDADDPGATSEVVLASGVPDAVPGSRFPTRDFPPPWLRFGAGPSCWCCRCVSMRLGCRAGSWRCQRLSLEPAAAIRPGNLAAPCGVRRGCIRLPVDAPAGEEATNLKGRFLSMVSHELRTPLGVVAGLSDIRLVREAHEGDGGTSPPPWCGTWSAWPRAPSTLGDSSTTSSTWPAARPGGCEWPWNPSTSPSSWVRPQRSGARWPPGTRDLASGRNYPDGGPVGHGRHDDDTPAPGDVQPGRRQRRRVHRSGAASCSRHELDAIARSGCRSWTPAAVCRSTSNRLSSPSSTADPGAPDRAGRAARHAASASGSSPSEPPAELQLHQGTIEVSSPVRNGSG